MLDAVIGLLALATLAGFLAVVVGFVPEADLATVIVVVLAMAAFDLYRSTFRRG
jgi:hypothetical protein